MNHHKHHRINTEEYQHELQELNNSAQLPLLPRSQMTYPPEAKGRATHYPITHAQPLMKSEPLLKANFKQLKQMFPNTNEHDHVLKWASDIKNNDLQSFYLRHYRNNPSIHTDAMKEKIGHINGMIDISDEMKKVKLSKEDTLESGLQKYEDAEKKWQTGNGSRFVTPSATTKPVIDFGDGWGWFDLGVPADRDEGNALGHCGNAGSPHENDRILSLRNVHNIGGKIYHEPALTFINNQGWIGEMKGRNNSKPSEKYHSRISELLKHKDIKGLIGAGYMPENNFHFDDLSPEHKNQVKMTNPEFVDLRSNEWDIDHKTNFAKKAPKIEKYENTIRDTFKAHNLKTDLDSGKFTMDDIQPEDLRLVANHPHFERKNFDRLVENVHRFQHENQLHAYGTIKNSRHLTSDDLHTLLDNNLSSVDILKDHRLIDLSHINKVVFKNPRLAARVLNNHRLLNSQHIDKIIGKNPEIAADLLKNHKEFNSSHIDKIIENSPRATAVYLRNHPEFNSSHIDKIIGKNPGDAITWLSDHKEFNSSHIDKIIENSPRAAAVYLLNHPEFNSSHIDKIVEKEPETAAEHLKDHPIYKAKYGNMQKSFKQLTSEYEELQKVIFRNGTHYPESTDRVGTPHPELQHLVVHKARNGKHVWSYHPELSRIHDRNLLQLMGGQKIAGRNNVTLPNRLSSLQKPTVSAVKNFAADLLNNPDRHAMSANTDPTKPSHHAEMRVRHLINALTGSEGYEIKDHPEGFEVYAPRHSKSSKADDIATRWIYNTSKKDLRSERIYPTSPDGGGYGTKFGKSSFDGRRVDSDGSGPRPSSTTGGGRSNERVSAAQRPSSYTDALGKSEALGTESIRFSKAAMSDELRKAIGRDGNRRFGKTDRGSGANLASGRETQSSKDVVGKNKTLVKSLKQLTKEYEMLKRSKNAKQQIKNISEEERKKRISAYAQKIGLTPVHDVRDEEQGLPNSYSGSQFYFNPDDEIFPPEHEIGHTMLTPEGESVGEYMKRISSSPTQKEERDEIIAHALDAKIARRAGIAPRSVVPPPDLYEDAGEPIPKPLTFKTAFSPYQNEVKEIIGQFDEGKKFDSKGIKTIKDSIDRKINIRAKEAAKDVSRKDAKTLMRSQTLKKAEDEAGMTAYPLKDGYSLHHETTSNGYDIWSIGHGGQRAGSFMICTDETRRGRPFVSWAGVDKPHRGKGVGAAVYKTLAVHYGGLDSDRDSTSVDALKAWHRAGGKQLKSKTQFGDYRYTLKGDKKRPPIVWNEDLEKTRGTLTFPKVLPKDTRPEETIDWDESREIYHAIGGKTHE